MTTNKSIFRMLSVFLIVMMIASSVGVTPAHAAGILYAAPSAAGTGDCSGWANACTLQTALTNAVFSDEIWVMAGTHKPTAAANRSATFQLQDGVALYGGFAGSETARSERNPAVNITILSGDLNGDDNSNIDFSEPTRADNSYHVVTGATGGTLDGFTITAGNAYDGSGCPLDCGGGMYNSFSSPTLASITFTNNSAAENGGGLYNEVSDPALTNSTFTGNSAGFYGGGMHNSQSNPTLTGVTFTNNSAGAYGGGLFDSLSNPTLANITFTGNSAVIYGGGMYNEISSPSLTDVTFSGNTADQGAGLYNESSGTTLANVTFSGNIAGSSGGGMLSTGGSPTLTNVTFSGNSASFGGGGLFNSLNSMTMTNVTFSANSAALGGGLYNSQGSPQIRNTIFWGNTAGIDGAQIYDEDFSSTPVVSYSVVQAGYASGTNIITTNPQLGTLGNYGGFTETIPLLVEAGSSAIDTGNDATCAATDQRGITRPQGAHCDIGAFEYKDITPPTVNTFTATSPSSTLNIPITAFSASDDSAVTGYLITTSATPPTAGAIGWTGSAPVTFSVASAGSYTLYPWAKDAAGNVSAVFGTPANVTVDIAAPTVDTFTATSLINSLNIPITAFTASDDAGVTGYLITTSATPPAAGAVGWTGSAPTTYTVGGAGTYTLYPWAKDVVGHVSAVFASPRTVVVDTSAPVVNTFTATSPTNSLSIPITGFTASDDATVTGYLITASATPPAAGAVGWTGAAPSTYTVASAGTYTLYPWAKDAAGNVSAEFASPRTVVVDTTAPTVTSITRINPSPTFLDSVGFTLTFSEPVTGVDTIAPFNDFTLTTTGVLGAAVSGVSGTGSVYTVTVDTGTGNGTVRLDVVDDDTILDASSNPLNGGYTAGETYDIARDFTLTITSANGTVAKNPDQAIYHDGDVVQLTATPDTGWSFANWTGDLTSSLNPASVTIHGNTSVTANYTQNEYTLTITSANGTVAKNPNQATYHEGDVVQLTATPDTGWSFANWTGDLTSSLNPASVTIHGNTSVTANYTQNEYTLTITSANGTVAKNPNQATYHEGDVVQLTATPDTGWSFANWTGDLTSSLNPASVTIHGNTSVTANYTQNEYTLTITSANGTVAKNPNQATYHEGDVVQLTATPDTGWSFANWTGGLTSSLNPDSVTIHGNTSVTANYTQNEYTLTITSANGTVAKNPNQATYHEGDVVQLTATPDTGWSFANWTGDLTSSLNPDSVTIHGNTAVTANYTLDNRTPTDVSISNNSVAEGQAAGTTVGTFSSTDPDAGDTFTYSLVSGTGSADNAAFTISGSTLKTAYPFNFMSKNSYSIRVRTTDQGGLNFEKAFTINVTDLPAIFVDVPDTYWANSFIERLYNAGITSGCSTIPLNYCPTTPVTRAQMAIFLLRGVHGSAYTPPSATGVMFNDVPASSFAAAWIEQLATEGITSGCGGGNFCPNSPVTRASMAVFLVRAKHGASFVPPTATGVFTDVPPSSFGADFIEQLAADAITSGCGPGIYCPNSSVTRDSMAVFLVRTFNLP